MKQKLQKGFTLIELLVVIGIIGILLSMIVASFSTAQSSSRDALRRSDIKVIQDAFEQYYADVDSGTGAIRLSYNTCDTMTSVNYFTSGSRPVDPKNAGSYVYSCAGDISSYCVCALLEKEGSGNASDGSCTYASGGDYYCFSNLQ